MHSPMYWHWNIFFGQCPLYAYSGGLLFNYGISTLCSPFQWEWSSLLNIQPWRRRQSWAPRCYIPSLPGQGTMS
jgi:hypothetical protein